MVLEPWMVKTALVLGAINLVNLLLLWFARRREQAAYSAVEQPMASPVVPFEQHAHRDAA